MTEQIQQIWHWCVLQKTELTFKILSNWIKLHEINSDLSPNFGLCLFIIPHEQKNISFFIFFLSISFDNSELYDLILLHWEWQFL